MNGSNTIEPNLISLLNYEAPDTSISPSLDLPTLQDLNMLKKSGRILLPEPDTRNRIKNPNRAESSHTVSILTIEDDENLYKVDERRKCSSDTVPKCVLRDSSRQSLRKILEEEKNCSLLTKKRRLVDQNKDDFVQLPQPLKKQKNTMQVVPPIIIGLYEPPPQATLLPPIASSSFHDSHGRNSLNIEHLSDKILTLATKWTPINNDLVPQKKSIATRKKWTGEETNNLLLGVHKHGVGCWTDILNDSNFIFNGRSPADLKDRWRTCCPDELRKNVPRKEEAKNSPGAQVNPSSSLMTANILINNDSTLDEKITQKRNVDKQKRRAHRKNLEDLAQLGIEGPIRQSKRRERRQFTHEEDRAILEGYDMYGPAWSKIQKDPRLKLESRRPTDLRDRFRNKFPQKFREDRTMGDFKQSLKPKSKGTEKLDHYNTPTNNISENLSREPVPTLISQTSFPTLPCRDGLRIEEIISTESIDTLADQPSVDAAGDSPLSNSPCWGQSANAHFSSSIGEMDISRLLLDGSWTDMPSTKEKQSHAESNNLLTASTDTNHQLPSFFNMLNDPDDLDEEPFG